MLPEAQPLDEYSDIDRVRFEQEIRPAGKPVILRGVARSWPCVAAAENGNEALSEYMLQFDQGQKAITYLAKPEADGRYFYSEDMRGFNFEWREIAISKVVAKLLELASEDGPMGVYAGAGSSTDLFPGFAYKNTMPLLDDTVSPLVWISNSARIAPHYDASDNIAVTVSGKRNFTLFPPSQIANLYVGPIEFTMAGQPASLVDPANPDLERFPKYAAAMEHALSGDMEPGDAIYIPALWWHTVQSHGPFNMLVNYWWGNDTIGSGSAALVHALLSIRDLPPTHKAAWREIFDHYIFSPDAEKMTEHVPAHARGALGQANDERNGHIISFLKNALSKL